MNDNDPDDPISPEKWRLLIVPEWLQDHAEAWRDIIRQMACEAGRFEIEDLLTFADAATERVRQAVEVKRGRYAVH